MDKKLFAFLYCLCLCSYALGCGTSLIPSNKRKTRIIGGKSTLPGQYPWMLSLQENVVYGFVHACGAALINENWALSAGHCVEDYKQPKKYQLLAGLHQLSREDAPSVQLIKISKIFVHRGFNFNTLRDDIALFKTAHPVDISGSRGFVNKICLPLTNADPKGNATVIGWGYTYEDGHNSDVLREVYVPMIPRNQCNKGYDANPYDGDDIITSSMICAGSEKKDACQNDSGGPLFQTNSEGVSTMIGIVSKGAGCGNQDYPGIYTKVSAFKDWMDDIMKKN